MFCLIHFQKRLVEYNFGGRDRYWRGKDCLLALQNCCNYKYGDLKAILVGWNGVETVECNCTVIVPTECKNCNFNRVSDNCNIIWGGTENFGVNVHFMQKTHLNWKFPDLRLKNSIKTKLFLIMTFYHLLN